jgi:hypothetical protein
MDIPDEEIVDYFNRLFRNDIHAKGLESLTKSSIKAQYAKYYRESCRAWQEIEKCPDADLSWVSREMQALSLTGRPSLSQSSSRRRSSQSLGQSMTQLSKQSPTRKSTSVRIVIERPRPIQHSAPRGVFKKFPEDMAVCRNRTRKMFGEEVPIIRATDDDLIVRDPVLAAEAHSAVPELLFRFYDDNSQGARTECGFLSGYYSFLTIPPPAPPACSDDRLFATILNHLNKVRFGSELISTTSNLFFAMRLAAKSNANPRICVIRGSAMPSRKVYHAWPYHKRYKDGRMFYNGTYMNPSSHEYLVWASIPHTAILCDFSFADLEQQLLNNPQMSTVFRIMEMRTAKSNTHIQRDFMQAKPELTIGFASALAKIMPQFGVDAMVPGAVIARLVSEMIRGFKIDLNKTSPQRWQMLADGFTFALTDSAEYREDLIRVREAFLSGVRIGLGELNWHLNEAKQAKMLRKASQLGLAVQPRLPGNARVLHQAHGHEIEDEEAETDIEEDVRPGDPGLRRLPDTRSQYSDTIAVLPPDEVASTAGRISRLSEDFIVIDSDDEDEDYDVVDESDQEN